MNTIGLFINLVNGIYINNLASSTELDKDMENLYVLLNHSIHIKSGLEILEKKDIQILEIHDPAKKFKICLSHEYNNPWIAENSLLILIMRHQKNI